MASYSLESPATKAFPSVAKPKPEPAEETIANIGADYPRLRAILHDRGLSFKPIFHQRDVIQILGKCDKTVRVWTRTGKIPCCYWPSGEAFYTPQNLEDLFMQCERGRKAAH